LKTQPKRTIMDPTRPIGAGSHGLMTEFMELRYKHCAALDRAKKKFDEIDKDYGDFFGRSYGGQIEEYRTEDADFVILTSGSAVGTARTVVDAKRAEGVKVGLIKLRVFRPFPQEKLIKAIKGKKAVGVIDRSVNFGWNSGPIYHGITGALSGNRPDADIELHRRPGEYRYYQTAYRAGYR
jgi:pyruvate/2-oxoacid:ferredoxin oxidoreductase alpha subunit